MGLLVSLSSFDACYGAQNSVHSINLEAITWVDSDVDMIDEDFDCDLKSFSQSRVSVPNSEILNNQQVFHPTSPIIPDYQRIGLVRRYGPEQNVDYFMTNIYTNGVCPRGHTPFLICFNEIYPIVYSISDNKTT